MIASSAGRVDVVRYLLTLPDVDVKHTNSNKQTSLHYACSKNHVEVRFFIEKNCKNAKILNFAPKIVFHNAKFELLRVEYCVLGTQLCNYWLDTSDSGIFKF